MNKLIPFSIVIPTFERRELVCETVKLLGNLEYDGPFEVIVVVDGSSDGSAAALRSLSVPFPITILEQANRGAAHARNLGAKQAKGEVILFLDDDMTCAPNLLAQHARTYCGHADAVAGEITPDRELPSSLSLNQLATFQPREADYPGTAFDAFTGQLSVRRSVFEAMGGFDERYTERGGYGNEDLDFGARLTASYKFWINPSAVTAHRDRVSGARTLERARLLAIADKRFAAAHPHLAGELFERRGASVPVNRHLYRSVARVPLLRQLCLAVASQAHRLSPKSRTGQKTEVRRLFSMAYNLIYWTEVASTDRLHGPRQHQLARRER